jgi:hypothetical protein
MFYHTQYKYQQLFNHSELFLKAILRVLSNPAVIALLKIIWLLFD